VFEDVADVELIEVMGEATRDESTATAQRLLAVGRLYARRAVELAEWNLWRTDVTEAVAAEVSAAQNVSRGRAKGQIFYGRMLCERLPAVAKVFVRGVIDFRMVAMIIARTENVDDAVIAELDESIAGRAEKWMKLSKPKLRDRIDMWVAKMDPAAVRVPPIVDDHRYLDVDPGAAAGMAFVSGHVHAADGAARSSGVAGEARAARVAAARRTGGGTRRLAGSARSDRERSDDRPSRRALLRRRAGGRVHRQGGLSVERHVRCGAGGGFGCGAGWDFVVPAFSPERTDAGPVLCAAKIDSVIDVIMKMIADSVVAFVNAVAAPRGPNAVWLPWPPKAAARSPLLPLCNRTTAIRNKQTIT